MHGIGNERFGSLETQGVNEGSLVSLSGSLAATRKGSERQSSYLEMDTSNAISRAEKAHPTGQLRTKNYHVAVISRGRYVPPLSSRIKLHSRTVVLVEHRMRSMAQLSGRCRSALMIG